MLACARVALLFSQRGSWGNVDALMTQAPTAIELRRNALDLAGRIDIYAAEVLQQQESYQNEGHRIALHALSVRMLQTSRAVWMLVGEGLNDGAAAVLRSLVEQHFVFTALLNKPDLMHQACKDEAAEQRKALKGLGSLPADCRPESITSEVLEAAIAQRDPGGFSVFDWAREAGLEVMYQTLWRHLSFNAHGALHAVNDYLVGDGGDTILRIRPNILQVRSIDFVLTAVGILMTTVGAIDRQPSTEQRRARREMLGRSWSDMRDQYYALAEAALE